MPIFQLSKQIAFPPPDLARDDGLLAVGGDLSPERLLLAYQMGIFPWYSEGDPILWWSPIPRLILEPHEFHLSKRLARQLRQNIFQFTVDQDFRKTITLCAKLRTGKGEDTWINQDMIEAYCDLHELGFAHSIECRQNDELVGGLYGVSIGGVFFGESMFATVTNSSKAALAVLTAILAKMNFDFIDCQMRTDHLLSLGAKEMLAKAFFRRLQIAVALEDHRGTWNLESFGSLDWRNQTATSKHFK